MAISDRWLVQSMLSNQFIRPIGPFDWSCSPLMVSVDHSFVWSAYRSVHRAVSGLPIDSPNDAPHVGWFVRSILWFVRSMTRLSIAARQFDSRLVDLPNLIVFHKGITCYRTMIWFEVSSVQSIRPNGPSVGLIQSNCLSRGNNLLPNNLPTSCLQVVNLLDIHLF